MRENSENRRKEDHAAALPTCRSSILGQRWAKFRRGFEEVWRRGTQVAFHKTTAIRARKAGEASWT